MDAIGWDGIHTVVLMWCAQMGKSEILFNILGFQVDMDPCPMIMLQPTISMAQAVSKDRIAPMFQACPTLREKVGDPSKKDGSNTMLHKKFPGGYLAMTGGNSAASLASRPARGGLGDEIDRLPLSAGGVNGEGDPWKLLEKRLATFHNRFKVMASTPTTKGESRIEMAYLATDQRKYHLPCPHCQAKQHLEWSGIHWAKDGDGRWDFTPPWYICNECGARIDETEKRNLVARDLGEWIPTATSQDPGAVGYHLNELYSPWRSWAEIVADFLESKGDSELMRVWTNTCLGETFEEEAIKVDKEGLAARREVYPAEVPAAGLVLTCGVDTQDDRLELQVDSWGLGEECHRIDFQVIYGDPDLDEVWAALDDFLLRKTYKHENGHTLGIASTCIDSGGHKTQRVYAYCKGKLGRRVFAIKGIGGFDRPMVSAPNRRKTGRQKRHVDLWGLGVDPIKASIYRRLEIQEPGPGFIHLPDNEIFDDEYIAQLTGEKLVTKLHRGRPVRHFKATRDRVEGLDCSVYSYGAFLLLNPDLEALAARLNPGPQEKPQDGPDSKKLRPSRRRAGGFASGWR